MIRRERTRGRGRGCLLAATAAVGTFAGPSFGQEEAPARRILYRTSLSAAPVTGSADALPFNFHPVVTTNLFVSDVAADSLGDKNATASIFTPGPLESVGGLAPQLIPSDLSKLPDVPLVPVDVPGLPPVPVPQPPIPPLPPYPLTVGASSGGHRSARVGAATLPESSLSEGSALSAAALVEEADVIATASGADLRSRLAESTGILTADAARSAIRLKTAADHVVGTAVSVLNGLDLAGVVRIDTLRAETSVIGDEEGGRVTSRLRLEGVRALGYEATIDERGVTIDNNGVVPPSTIHEANAALQNALDRLGLSLLIIPARSGTAPATGEHAATGASGALAISARVTVPDETFAGGTTGIVRFTLGATGGAVTVTPAPVFDFPGPAGDELTGRDATPGPGAGSTVEATSPRAATAGAGSDTTTTRGGRPRSAAVAAPVAVQGGKQLAEEPVSGPQGETEAGVRVRTVSLPSVPLLAEEPARGMLVLAIGALLGLGLLTAGALSSRTDRNEDRPA